MERLTLIKWIKKNHPAVFEEWVHIQKQRRIESIKRYERKQVEKLERLKQLEDQGLV